MKKLFLLALSLLVFVFVGCSQNTTKEDSKSTSEQSQAAHPPMTEANQQGEGAMMPKTPKQIAVPESVAKKFKAVNLEITDKKTNKKTTVKAAIGKKTTLPGTDITIYVEAYLPDFTMGTENITSASDEEKNPAAKVKIERKSNVSEGWLFKNFEIHKIEDPDYNFVLLGGVQ
jgi:ABC-type Fe3+-hydroxamate transport system substrate-binding protein